MYIYISYINIEAGFKSEYQLIMETLKMEQAIEREQAEKYMHIYTLK